MNQTPETERQMVEVLEIILKKPTKLQRKIIGINFPCEGKNCWYYIQSNGRTLIKKSPKNPEEFRDELIEKYNAKNCRGYIKIWEYPLRNITVTNHTH